MKPLNKGTRGVFEGATDLPIFAESKEIVLTGQTYEGVIGFTAAEVRGSLVVNMNESMVLNSLPMEIRNRLSTDPEEPAFQRTLNDWCGEVANQILGRAKNRISGFGPMLTLSNPISLRASGKVWGGSSATHEFRQCLERAEGQVLSIASVTIENDNRVEAISANTAASEAEMMLF